MSKLNTMKKAAVKEKASSALNNQQITREQVPSGRVLGGIDWTELEKYLQYDGNLKGLDLSFPLLSQAELERLDPQQEQEALDNQLLNVKVPANDDRLMRHLSGVFEKGQFSQLQPELIRYAQELCNFLEAKGLETTPRQRAFILTADTGIFIRQPAKYSPN